MQKKKSIINVSNIYCKDGYFYEEKCKLDDYYLLEILKFFYDFQSTHNSDELFFKIKDDIENTIENIYHKLSSEKKLVYKL